MSKQEGTAGILDVIRGMGGYIDENGMLQLRRGFCVGAESHLTEGYFRSLRSVWKKRTARRACVD